MAGRMLRLLGVLTVVAGVFAMHGLTSHHDPMTAMAAPVMAHTAPDTGAPSLHVAPADEGHGMSGACMAVLTGLVLLLALLLGLRTLLVWRAIRPLFAKARRVVGERSSPRVTPSSLGVLRI
ncbi:DUF6153 family protein [Kribbella sp. NPDC003557]|uniref:DUF6153 family protein n=1 Tax=Kribbella sp. NPDC003557 TaxID=3154449 RepID=UPI0033A8A180